MNRKVIIWIAASAIIIVGIGLYMFLSSGQATEKAEKKPEKELAVKITIAEYKNHLTDITAYGSLKADNKIDVYSEVSGKMLKSRLEFKEGVYFPEGSNLIKIDDREIKNSLLSQKSDFLRLLTQLMPDMKSDYPEAYKKWDKYISEFTNSDALRDLPEVKSKREKYFLSAAGVFSSYYKIKNTEIRLEKYTIEAPFSGSVTSSLVSPGSLINPGQKLGSFAETGDYELRLSMPLYDVKFISSGSEVKVYSEIYDKYWSGKIIRIGENVSPASQTIPVFAQLRGKGLKDGMYLEAKIHGIEIDSVIKIPRKALHNDESVFLVKQNQLINRKINIIKLSEYDAFIRGIPIGDTVVIEPLVGASEGTLVKPFNTEPGDNR